MICIFCLNDKQIAEFSEEHIFPEAIGGKIVLPDAVCTKCNSTLGTSIDVGLTDHELIAMKRYQFLIAGKRGRIPNPFDSGILNQGKPQQVRTEIDKNGKISRIYLTPKIEKEKLDDNTLRIGMQIDAADKDKIPSIIQKIIERAGSRAVIDKDSLDKLFTMESQTIENPSIQFKMSMSLTSHLRACLKIAYEFAYLWLGESTLSDERMRALREAILADAPPEEWADKYKLRGQVKLFEGEGMMPMFTNPDSAHIAYVSKQGSTVVCYLRIFKVFEGIIEVSASPDRYPDFQDQFCSIDASTGAVRQCRLVDEFLRLSHENRIRLLNQEEDVE